jgi:hypothetical protein
MKPWILGLALAGLTASGVSFVAIGTGHWRGACPTASDNATPVAVSAEPSSGDEACCELCKTCQPSPNKVYDVVDLKTGFQTATVEVPFVSFDEPPLAKPRAGAIVSVLFVESKSGVEVLPPPREVK